MKTTLKILSLVLLLTTLSAQAAKPNLSAPKNGNFIFNLSAEPATVHPIQGQGDGYSSIIINFVMDSLLTRDNETLEWKPRLAEKWEISKDKKVFTFFIRKDAKFSDGHALTAEDIKFSYDMIFDPKFEAAFLRPFYENFEKVEVTDPYTVKFYTKNNYFLNFDQAAGILVLPKHIYEDAAKSKKMTKTIVGAGPYTLEQFAVGQKIVLKRNKDWYGFAMPQYQGEYNFDSITFKFVKDENVSLEMIKRGDLDFLTSQTFNAELYMTKSDGPPWGQTVFKHKVINSSPKVYNFMGLNFRNPIFQDKRTRLALAYLLNREEMNKKFRFGLSELTKGPVIHNPDIESANVKAIPYDPKKAGELLKQAGWSDPNHTGILSKVIDGKPVEFRFTVMHANKNAEKFFTMYKEDLKKAGIDLGIKLVEWNSFQNILDDAKFDAIALSWETSVFWDPKQIWHSSSIGKGGSNFIGYKNPEVDKLIDEARVELDMKKRNQKLRVVYEKIVEDTPYLFMLNPKYDFYAITKRVSQPAETFKYDIGVNNWWIAP